MRVDPELMRSILLGIAVIEAVGSARQNRHRMNK